VLHDRTNGCAYTFSPTCSDVRAASTNHHEDISELANASWLNLESARSGSAANAVDARDGEMLALVELQNDGHRKAP
jgi:hypothetical protein